MGYQLYFLLNAKQANREDFLRVDNEQTNTAAEKQSERKLSAEMFVCLFMPRCGLGLEAVMVLQQGHACCT